MPKILVLAAALCLAACVSSLAESSKTNVLLISCDDLNQELGCYGNDQVRTPNIDRLARRGVRFERVYAQWASCLPSRVSFLSGWSPPRTKVWSFDFDAVQGGEGPLADVLYLPEHFHANGYTTARLDKIFHIGASVPRCWDIDEEPHKENGEFKAIWTGIEIKTLGLEDKVVREGRIDKEDYPMFSGESGSYQVMDNSVDDAALFDGHNAKRAVELLEQFAAEDTPFFLAVGFRRPHLPWIALDKDFAKYPPEEIQLPPQQPGLEAEFPDDKHREMIAHYYAATTFLDRQVGKVLDALEKTGLAENTVVVLLGDHGYMLGEKENHFGKGRLWDLALRPALILATPNGRRAGQADGRLVSLLDLYPTLVELAGLPAADTPLDGRSLVPLLENEDADWREAVMSYRNNKQHEGLDQSIRTENYRYTQSANGTPLELFDHTDGKDPYEWINVVDDPAYAEARERLAGMLGKP